MFPLSLHSENLHQLPSVLVSASFHRSRRRYEPQDEGYRDYTSKVCIFLPYVQNNMLFPPHVAIMFNDMPVLFAATESIAW